MLGVSESDERRAARSWEGESVRHTEEQLQEFWQRAQGAAEVTWPGEMHLALLEDLLDAREALAFYSRPGVDGGRRARELLNTPVPR